uniref:Bm11105 n=1 Tax=Brugia malayi TaxID=6279 RepID=A0A0J9Y432_BRUMA|nr:Bm11105 [Brugia malayi]
MTFNDAISECTELKAELAYPPDRGNETALSPESALLSYLAVRGGWVKEGTEEVEKVFVNWNIPDQREIKSRFFCKIKKDQEQSLKKKLCMAKQRKKKKKTVRYVLERIER